MNFSFFTLYSLLLLSFFLYLKSVPIYVIVHVSIQTLVIHTGCSHRVLAVWGCCSPLERSTTSRLNSHAHVRTITVNEKLHVAGRLEAWLGAARANMLHVHACDMHVHVHVHVVSLVPRPSPSSAPCALRVIIKCGGGKTEAEGLAPGRIYHVIRALSDVTLLYV